MSNNMNTYDIVVEIFAVITVVCAFFVVTRSNICHAADFLLRAFLGVAVFFVLLGADMVPIVQLIVYVGGILILLLFGVMLTNKITSVDIKSGTWQILPSIIGVGLFAAFLISTLTGASWKTYDTEIPAATTSSLGALLMQEYIIVFELLGILLLVALVGAASMARKSN